jgi:hypothetical protein
MLLEMLSNNVGGRVIAFEFLEDVKVVKKQELKCNTMKVV